MVQYSDRKEPCHLVIKSMYFHQEGVLQILMIYRLVDFWLFVLISYRQYVMTKITFDTVTTLPGYFKLLHKDPINSSGIY